MSNPSINRDEWSVIRFDQMAECLTVRVEPSETTLERYVGLEHLDPETLKISRWGTPSDVIGEKLHFWPGDIIFGKRRAYQKKLAVADFEGICSAHAMVLRARPEIVLPEFLPFFMQSDMFFERALSISVGSLSPTINWGTLAKQEFPLPPLDEQRRIAEILWAADETIEKYKAALLGLRTVEESYFKNIIDDLEKQGCIRQKLGELTLEPPSYGANASARELKHGDPRFIRITDIDDEGTLLSSEPVGVSITDYSPYILQEGDFLFARTGATVGKTYYYKNVDGFCVFAGYLIRFKLDPKLIIPEFLFRFTKTKTYFDWVAQTVRIGAQPNINASEYSELAVPLPSNTKQKEILELVSNISNSVIRVRTTMAKLLSMKNQLLEQILKMDTSNV